MKRQDNLEDERCTLTSGNLSFTACTRGSQGPLVLCLHGFPDHASTFRYQLSALADAGYRVIAPHMRGYEPTSQPASNDYALMTLAGDVLAWMDDLGEDKVHLVGHDWGAAVTYLAGSMAPERFLSLTTLAVPHAARLNEGVRAVPGQLLKSWYMTFFQLRGIADYTLARNDWALIKKLWKDWSPGYTLSDAEWVNMCDVFDAPGVRAAMLAYYRQNATPGMLLGLTKTEAASLTCVPVRTLAITGADDGCMDTRLYDHVFQGQDFPKGYRVERIEGAGHFVHLEKPDLVNSLLLDWLKEE